MMGENYWLGPILLTLLVFFSQVLAFEPKKSPLRLLDVSQSSQTVQMTLLNQQNQGYYTTIMVGDPSETQLFSMLFDIGTPWIWIPDQTCSNCVFSDVNSPYFDCSDNSDTCTQDTTTNYTLTYPTGNTIAYSGKEIVLFNGLPLNVSVNCSMYFATQISSSFYNTQANGIMGLGLNSVLNNTNDFLNNLYNQGLISAKQFSLFITDDYFGIDQISTLIFGGYSSQFIEGNASFQFASVSQGNGWAVGINGFQVGNISIPIQPANALLSTIFPDIGVPSGFINNLVTAFGELGFVCIMTGGYTNPICKGEIGDIDNLPILYINGTDINFKLLPSEYTVFSVSNAYDNISTNDGFNIVLQFREIQIQNFNQMYAGKWILGNSFLRNYYILCDQDNQRLGFAPSSNLLFNWTNSSVPAIIMITLTAVFLVVSCCVLGVVFYKRIKVADTSKDQYLKLENQSVAL